MARTRRVVYYPGSISNGASLGFTNVSTPDDNFPKVLKSIHVSPATVKARVQVAGGGYTFEDFDATRCAAGNWPVQCDEPFPAQILFQVNVINNTGSGYDCAITLEYEPSASTGGVSRSPLGA